MPRRLTLDTPPKGPLRAVRPRDPRWSARRGRGASPAAGERVSSGEPAPRLAVPVPAERTAARGARLGAPPATERLGPVAATDATGEATAAAHGVLHRQERSRRRRRSIPPPGRRPAAASVVSAGPIGIPRRGVLMGKAAVRRTAPKPVRGGRRASAFGRVGPADGPRRDDLGRGPREGGRPAAALPRHLLASRRGRG